MIQPGFFDVEERLRELSKQGDPLEALSATVDFEIFRPVIDRALGRPDRSKGGRPEHDRVLKFRMLVLKSMHGLSFARTEYLVRDRLSWMRFCGLGLGDGVPDANTLWDFQEDLIAADALDDLFAELDRALTGAGYLAMSGQILDASIVEAPRPRNSRGEKAELRAGRVPADWEDLPAKRRQKDIDARWTVKVSHKRAVGADGKTLPPLTIPAFGYKSHVSIDRRYGLIRCQRITHAAAHDGTELRRGLIDQANTASDVWADSAYRSAANERYLEACGKVSRIHRKKPRGKPMPRHIARGNATRSKIRARVEHVFAEQKSRMGLTIKSVGLARAKATITMANMAYNMKRWCWLDGRSVPG